MEILLKINIVRDYFVEDEKFIANNNEVFGDKLIFNGTLRIISYITPTDIGGTDDVENLICASNRHTFQIKSSTPEEVGWKVLPSGNLADWGGTLSWFMRYVEKNPEVKKIDYIKKCYKACEALKIS